MVIYVICFDLSASPDEQTLQIDSWLSYLNSLLCRETNISPHHSNAKWKVMIAGTRADKQHPHTILLTSTLSFQQLFPAIPFHDNIYRFSTLHDPKSVKALYKAIVDQCNQIMDAHSNYLPTFYKMLKEDISLHSSPTDSVIAMSSLPTRWKENPEFTNQALQHLHSIGEIVMFGDDKICTNPEVLSKLMAKFISPREVQAKLLGDRARLFLLKKEDMQAILEVKDTRY